MGDRIAHLYRWGFHVIGADGLQRTADAALQPQLGATHSVDDHARAVGGILNRQSEFEIEWDIPEAAPRDSSRSSPCVISWKFSNGPALLGLDSRDWIE